MNWHPEAKRIPYPDAGPMSVGRPKLVWHTTEGHSLPTYSGSAPHFTLDPRTGQLWQHTALDRCARSLEHPAGTVETNRAHAIQVELIGGAADTPNWTDNDYTHIAQLARWIEHNAGVAPECTVQFSATPGAAKRMGTAEWLNYNGHCGHQHVPVNHHWDPGGFRIDRVLDRSTTPHRTLRGGEQGEDVRALQVAINHRVHGCHHPEREVAEDGVYGPATRKQAGWVGWLLGMRKHPHEVTDNGLSKLEQQLIRHPDQRRADQKARAAVRRRKHCK